VAVVPQQVRLELEGVEAHPPVALGQKHHASSGCTPPLRRRRRPTAEFVSSTLFRGCAVFHTCTTDSTALHFDVSFMIITACIVAAA